MTATAKMELPPLYVISDELLRVIEQIEEAEGDITPEMEAAFDDLTGARRDKLDRVACYVDSREAARDAKKAVLARLRDGLAADERAIERLKAYLMRDLERHGETNVQGLIKTIRIQRNSRAAVLSTLTIEQLADLHTFDASPFVRLVPATYTLDRDAVLAAAKAGQSIPEGITVEVGTHIRIT